eukprot:m.26822 g.26822  ORF g.26822 m.26822 type:complete len:55 (-) comp11575_c0_seq2:157-321(-)
MLFMIREVFPLFPLIKACRCSSSPFSLGERVSVVFVNWTRKLRVCFSSDHVELA